ncbi:tail fiber assembly protein [Pantoea agglomerans]|uniref:tail fiber assembly protein n=1 Tax=Enterobacter agglomerans TaxID=549 RepID=UPI003D809808
MLTLKNINTYKPEYYDLMPPCLYLQTEDGKDWYYHRLKFQADTLKICYDSDNVIRMASYNAEYICPPSGCSVSEVAPDEVPVGFNDLGDWIFDGAGIVARVYTAEELIAQAEALRAKLLAQATTALAPLQDAIDFDLATDAERTSLDAWKTFRVLLNRLDISTAPDIEWPVKPGRALLDGKA